MVPTRDHGVVFISCTVPRLLFNAITCLTSAFARLNFLVNTFSCVFWPRPFNTHFTSMRGMYREVESSQTVSACPCSNTLSYVHYITSITTDDIFYTPDWVFNVLKCEQLGQKICQYLFLHFFELYLFDSSIIPDVIELDVDMFSLQNVFEGTSVRAPTSVIFIGHDAGHTFEEHHFY